MRSRSSISRCHAASLSPVRLTPLYRYTIRGRKSREKRPDHPFGLLAVLVLALVLDAAVHAGAAAAQPSIAFRLATIDCGCVPSPARVARYRIVLRSLRPKCKERPARLGDAAVRATEIFRHDTGRRVTTLAILRGTRTAVSKLRFRTSCSQVLAALVVLMEKG